jgi:hypothetical protein
VTQQPPWPDPRLVDDVEVIGRCLGELHQDVEVTILVEDARVDQLVFRCTPIAAAVLLHERGIREGRLRILVQVLHVRMRRGGIEVEVVLLDVLAVIALVAG